MRSFIRNHQYYFWLTGIFLTCEVIVNPIGEFPLNDDWSYAISVLTFQNEGSFVLGDWPAMTLVSHIVWGLLFTKTLGFSFFALRLSSIVSSLLGILFLYKLLLRVSAKKKVAFVGALCLLCNPLYFNLSNTFMTDVNFNTLIILCMYFAYDFFKTKNMGSLVLVFGFSILLVFLRQYGIVVPVCFIVCCLFTGERKWMHAGISVFLFIVLLISVRYYESWLMSTLGPDSAYKFLGKIEAGTSIFWSELWGHFQQRYKIVFFHALFYTFPFLIIYCSHVFIKFSKITVVTMCVLCASIVLWGLKIDELKIGNIFFQQTVGTETFYESIAGTFPGMGHTYTTTGDRILVMIKLGFSVGSFIIVTLLLLAHFRGPKVRFLRPEILFPVALLLFYTFLLLIAETFFDRYHIPIITFLILAFVFFANEHLTHSFRATLPLLCFFYIAVFGTKDYLELHRKSNEAHHYLRYDRKVPANLINVGFEIFCWNNQVKGAQYIFTDLDHFKYLVQYDAEPGFRFIKSFPFQRYFPYRTDSINIFAKDSIK